ncbi:hypothetical protein EV682_11723 [Iodobacter fluviatilis]|uniref:Uncharacterized protein n=1 Tax=Iodobacter fluviatilis TaxID=537 RepID=A0A377SS16_9NEIS|nr:hypothetical protein EV682_11723 [Iodobacter fluviatilis]STR44864.1 Uncharacterised protein [Iodobacter fluviatilis]
MQAKQNQKDLFSLRQVDLAGGIPRVGLPFLNG